MLRLMELSNLKTNEMNFLNYVCKMSDVRRTKCILFLFTLCVYPCRTFGRISIDVRCPLL